MTYRRTVLCLKGPSRENVVDNFGLISCQPLMWKLLTGMTAIRCIFVGITKIFTKLVERETGHQEPFEN